MAKPAFTHFYGKFPSALVLEATTIKASGTENSSASLTVSPFPCLFKEFYY